MLPTCTGPTKSVETVSKIAMSLRTEFNRLTLAQTNASAGESVQWNGLPVTKQYGR